MVNSEKYKGLDIYYHSDWNNEIRGFSFTATVFDSKAKNENDYLFVEKTQISSIAVRIIYHSLISDEASKDITEKTFAKVKTRIDFGLYEKGNEYFQQITSENIEEVALPMEDTIIQDYLLKGLINLRKANPLTYIALSFNPVGFCEILKIPLETYYFNADILLEEGLISTKIENGIEEGMLYITSKGFNYANTKTKKEEIRKVSSLSNASSTPSNIEKYDIAISFAGEDRELAEKIAVQLTEKQVNVFYDDFAKSDLWGKNLYDYLSEIYSEKSKYCVMILSEHYEKKLWTNLERKSAQARAFRENREYILPIRIDSTKISGIHETVGYIDAKTHSIENIVDLILSKLQKI